MTALSNKISPRTSRLMRCPRCDKTSLQAMSAHHKCPHCDMDWDYYRGYNNIISMRGNYL